MCIADLIKAEYRSPDELAAWDEHEWRDVLGLVRISPTEAVIDAVGVPVVHVAAPTLGRAAPLFEVWRTAGSLACGHDGRVRHRSSGAVLFGCVEVWEREAPQGLGEGTALRWATALAYREIFRCLEARGFPHLWRVWNYLPEIDRGTADSERYRQFKAARQHAFHDAGRGVGRYIPAACALGLAPQCPL